MMKLQRIRPFLLIGISLLGGVGMPLASAGDAAEGAKKAIFCAYCHGADGNPVAGDAPRLAGQNARTLAIKMKHQVPNQDMHHPMMQAFITGGVLNDRDIENLAAYFASQPIRMHLGLGTPATASR